MGDTDAPRTPTTLNLNGGIHRVPVPGLPGALWLCGKHLIAPDPLGTLNLVGATHVVCLVREFELFDRYPTYLEWVRTSPSVTWFPIDDLGLPPLDDVRNQFEAVHRRLLDGETVIVHCAAGIGRAGSFAVAVCMLSGMNLDEAMNHVRHHRPGAGPEVGEQRAVLEELGRVLGV